MKKLIKKILVEIVRFVINIFGQNGRRRISSVMREAMSSHGYDEVIKEIKTVRGTIRFHCLDQLPLWRAETLLSKEPETIDWIDGMEEGAIMYDIGANIGAYTLYGAINRKMKVLAFEPLAANYYLINRNIEKNNLSDHVKAYCLALNDIDLIGSFHVTDTGFGSAMSSFNEPVDYKGEAYVAKFEQGMVGMSLDSFIAKFKPDFPTHIKIDVDGIEDKIISGAVNTLQDSRLKAISIELDDGRPDYTGAIISAIEKAGFKLDKKLHSPMFDETEFSKLFNYQFRR